MSAPAAALERASILLVDDRPSNLTALVGVLRRPDYDLVLARSGSEALGQVLRGEFAVILLDVAMPGMDGFEVASLIKEREQSKLIPIIFITASVYDMEHIFQGYTVGAVDYLRKPLDPHALRSKVAVFVELHRQRRQIERQSAMLREAERQQQLLLVAENVAERKQIEIDRSRLVRELEEGITARDDFLALAAHELKTPMTPLRLQAESLARSVVQAPGEPLPVPQLTRRLEAIGSAAERLESLIDRLLDVSRLRLGGLLLDVEEVDLVAVVRNIAGRMRRASEAAGSPITVCAEAPVVGRWDRLRVEQVVMNLLANAIKYGEGKPIEVGVAAAGEVARLSVRDRGLGIPGGRAGEADFRAVRARGAGASLRGPRAGPVDRASRRRGPRRARERPERARRRLRVHGHAPPRPRGRRARAQEHPRAEGGEPMNHKQRSTGGILVVEDDALIRESLCDALESEGYDVVMGSNGQEALALLRAMPAPCLILLDLMMPVMTGVEFLAAIRRIAGFAAIPVVVVSAWPDEAAKVSDKTQGYLKKPVSLNALLTTIQTFCAARARRAPPPARDG